MENYLVRDKKGPLSVETDLERAREIASAIPNGELWYVNPQKAEQMKVAIEVRRILSR